MKTCFICALNFVCLGFTKAMNTPNILRCLLFSCAVSAGYALSENSEEKFNVCYFSSWARYRVGDGAFVPNDIDPNLCTHVIYCFALMDNVTFELKAEDPWGDLPPTEAGGHYDGYGDTVRLKERNPDLKVLLATGGWNAGSGRYSDMAMTKESRATFIQSTVQFVLRYQFDGFDLDWEYPGKREGSRPEDKENFALLVKEFREVNIR